MDPKSTERERLERGETRPLPGGGRAHVYESEIVHELNPDVVPDARLEARDRSIGSLLKELRDELTTLFRQELALAKTEMGEKARVAGRSIAAIATGGVFVMAGLLVLLLAISALLYWVMVTMGLSAYHAGWIAPLIVGGVTALIGYGLLQSGLNRLREQSPVPEKTVQSLKEDQQWLKNQTK
jgi:hypothetical protein